MRLLSPIALLILAACSPDAGAVQTDDTGPVAAMKAGPSSPPVPGGVVANDAAPSQQPTLAVESDGLRWFLPPNGSARPLAFGAPEAEVLASLERVRGPAEKGVNQDCGAGPVQYANWPDGLSVVFQDGVFAGWSLDPRASGALSTANGVGPGTTRSALSESFGSVSFQDTSLGTEFSAGDIFGLLDGTGPEAKVTHMWAGVSCVAR